MLSHLFVLTYVGDSKHSHVDSEVPLPITRAMMMVTTIIPKQDKSTEYRAWRRASAQTHNARIHTRASSAFHVIKPPATSPMCLLTQIIHNTTHRKTSFTCLLTSSFTRSLTKILGVHPNPGKTPKWTEYEATIKYHLLVCARARV